MPILVESIDEFRQRHGDSAHDGRREIFQDGALIEHEGRSRSEPPTDPKALLMVRYAYTRAKVAKLVSVFRQVRQNVKTQIDFHARNVGPPPHYRTIEALQELAEEIIEWKIRLEELEKQTPAGVRAQQQDRLDACRNQETQRTYDAIQKLPLF